MKFNTGQLIPESGIYIVNHSEHRLPHEVTLLQSQIFPRCSNCRADVQFELLRAVKPEPGQIVLYEIPVLIEAEEGYRKKTAS